MKISYLLLLIGYIFCTSENSHFYDINYNTEYTVDVNRYEEKYLPAGHSYYFRLAVSPNDKMEIQCTVDKNAITYFKVDVCAFAYRPSDVQVETGYNGVCADNLQGQRTEYTDRDKYSYPFTTGENVQYLAIHLLNTHSLYYLTVYVYSEKGMAGGIIALIIILPCLIIVGVVVAVLRFCCGCNICMGGSVRVNMI